MTYRIDEENGTIDVRIERTGADDVELLAAFARCRDGRCDCPTDEYQKLEEMRIAKDDRGISLQLKAKEGRSISKEAVERCLEHTLRGKTGGG